MIPTRRPTALEICYLRGIGPRLADCGKLSFGFTGQPPIGKPAPRLSLIPIDEGHWRIRREFLDRVKVTPNPPPVTPSDPVHRSFSLGALAPRPSFSTPELTGAVTCRFDKSGELRIPNRRPGKATRRPRPAAPAAQWLSARSRDEVRHREELVRRAFLSLPCPSAPAALRCPGFRYSSVLSRHRRCLA